MNCEEARVAVGYIGAGLYARTTFRHGTAASGGKAATPSGARWKELISLAGNQNSKPCVIRLPGGKNQTVMAPKGCQCELKCWEATSSIPPWLGIRRLLGLRETNIGGARKCCSASLAVELHDAQPLWSSATNPSCCRGKGHKLHCCTTVQLHNCTTAQVAVIPTSSSRSVPACAGVYHQLERQWQGRKKLPFCAETSERGILTMGDHPLIPDPARQGKVLQGFSKSGGTSFPLS